MVWNNTDVPLAYLITFRTYGSWLAGDARGSVDRFHNKYLEPRVERNPALEAQQVKKLKGTPVTLNSKQRSLVEAAIHEVCKYRKWKLYAINVRTNHIHVVAAGTAGSDKVLNDLKSYSTRKMKENECWKFEHSPWADKGSKRKLWTEKHIYDACNYVNNGQGGDLPDFL